MSLLERLVCGCLRFSRERHEALIERGRPKTPRKQILGSRRRRRKQHVVNTWRKKQEGLIRRVKLGRHGNKDVPTAKTIEKNTYPKEIPDQGEI